MTLIATDLDRTLLPNGKQKYDKTMTLFNKLIKKYDFSLIYITGRNTDQIKDAIKKYKIPYPNYAITLVGSEIKKIKNKKFVFDNSWRKDILLKQKDWNIKEIQNELKDIEGLRLQKKEYLSEFKISYYLDLKKNYQEKLKEIRKKINSVTRGYNLIFSIDYPVKRGLVDILPLSVSKVRALDYIIKKEKIRARDVVCCGDSGNDIDLLTTRYKSIIVANADVQIKNQVKRKRARAGLKELYIARKKSKLNGNYVSGIIQGLLHFDLIKKHDLDLK